jgi:hypothetical protein
MRHFHPSVYLQLALAHSYKQASHLGAAGFCSIADMG